MEMDKILCAYFVSCIAILECHVSAIQDDISAKIERLFNETCCNEKVYWICPD